MGCDQSTVVEHNKDLFNSIEFGSFKAKNRVIMAAMTRCRADAKTGTPTDIHVKYYSERAEDAGVVFTECSSVSARGNNLPGSTCIYNKDHMVGWKKVVDAVHEKKGRIFSQMYHCGRIGNTGLLGGQRPVAPSSVKMRHDKTCEEPEELDIKGIKSIIKEFVDSAKLLKETGFDGVELLAGNGYIVDQFLCDATNKRTDEYGGSIEKRSKFLLEIIDGLSSVFGANKVGAKLSFGGRYNDMFDSDPVSLMNFVFQELNKRKICFVEIVRPPEGHPAPNLYGIKGEDQIPDVFKDLKKKLSNVTIVGNCSFTPDEANKLIGEKVIDMVSFAKNYLANPDLCNRIKNKWELAQPDWATLYGPFGEKGYTDYPKYKKPEEKKPEEKTNTEKVSK